MNQARLWLVVKPTVGVPLLLGSVAVAALIVHIGILTHTTWFPAYWEGHQHARQAALSTTAPLAAALPTGQVAVASK